jgi:hypothetical protein
MTANIFSLLACTEKQKKIRTWLNIAGIKLIHFDKERHIFKTSNEVVIDAFWYIINKVISAKQNYQLVLYKNIILNTQRTKNNNIEEIKSFVDIVSDYSQNHINVLKLIDGIMDYFVSIGTTESNSIPPTIENCIECAIVELSKHNIEIQQIWEDLFQLGLRKESSLHRWMTVKMFVYMSLVTEQGKTFLKYIEN